MDINAIWDAIAPYVTGTGIGAIIGGIMFACLKGAFEKTISKVNYEKTAEKMCNKTLEKVKTVSFSQNIQPMVEDEMKKVLKVMNEHLDETVGKTQDNYEALLNVMIALSAYFNNGYGIPEEVKENLNKAIKEAQETVEKEMNKSFSVTIDDNQVVVETKQEVKAEKNDIVR